MSVYMVEDFSLQMVREVSPTENHIRNSDPTNQEKKMPEQVVHPVEKDSLSSRTTSAKNVTLQQPPPGGKIRLALEKLQGFEQVEDQFQHWGIKFNNAIAIQPSNPRFGIEPGVTVLMGAPKGGIVEVTFTHPVRKVLARVTSPRHTVMSAFDHNGELLNQDHMTVIKSSDSISSSSSSILPNAQLSVKAKNIYKITFYTFDAQLVVDHFKVEF